MKMLMVVYTGTSPHRVASLLEAHHADGYTEFRNAHGVGTTGRHEGSRAWPGEATLFVSVVPAERSDELVTSLHDAAGGLPPGERLHVAVLPTETFF